MANEGEPQSFIAVFVDENGNVQVGLQNFSPDFYGIALILEAAAAKLKWQTHEMQLQAALEKQRGANLIIPQV